MKLTLPLKAKIKRNPTDFRRLRLGEAVGDNAHDKPVTSKAQDARDLWRPRRMTIARQRKGYAFVFGNMRMSSRAQIAANVGRSVSPATNRYSQLNRGELARCETAGATDWFIVRRYTDDLHGVLL